MKRVGFLFEKLVSFDNLLTAASHAFRGKKDKNRVARFYFHLEDELIALQDELIAKAYHPLPIRTFRIWEPKQRLIGASDFRDRVVHHAICNVIEPFFERSYIYHSYACRKGKGMHRALARAQKYCRKFEYFLKLDVRKFFENIDHDILKTMLRGKFKDPDLLDLLEIIIDSPGGDKPGIPIGSLTSQHFANFYLDRLDHYIKDVLGVKGYLRYMDDFLLFANDKETLHVNKAKIAVFLCRELRLQLNEKACVIAPCGCGVPFLGFRIFPGIIRFKRENKKRILNTLERRTKQYRRGEIAEDRYAQSLNSITGHLKIAGSYNLRKHVFGSMF